MKLQIILLSLVVFLFNSNANARCNSNLGPIKKDSNGDILITFSSFCRAADCSHNLVDNDGIFSLSLVANEMRKYQREHNKESSDPVPDSVDTFIREQLLRAINYYEHEANDSEKWSESQIRMLRDRAEKLTKLQPALEGVCPSRTCRGVTRGKMNYGHISDIIDYLNEIEGGHSYDIVLYNSRSQNAVSIRNGAVYDKENEQQCPSPSYVRNDIVSLVNSFVNAGNNSSIPSSYLRNSGDGRRGGEGRR